MSEEALNENYGCTEVRKFTLTAKWKTPDGETNEKDFKDKVLNAGGKYEDLKLNFQGVKCTKKIRLDDETTGIVIYSMNQNALDLDGCPRAYHPEGLGIDDNGNAGILKVIDAKKGIVMSKGKTKKNKDGTEVTTDCGIYGIVAEKITEQTEQDKLLLAHETEITEGEKERLYKASVQSTTDPYPGYFVSTTAVSNGGYTDESNPNKHINSENIPYIAVSLDFLKKAGVKKGNIGIATNLKSCKTSYFIIGDIRSDMTKNEMSIKLSENLGLKLDKVHRKQKNGSTIEKYVGIHNGDILLNIFIGTGNEKGKQVSEIEQIGKEYYEKFTQ